MNWARTWGVSLIVLLGLGGAAPATMEGEERAISEVVKWVADELNVPSIIRSKMVFNVSFVSPKALEELACLEPGCGALGYSTFIGEAVGSYHHLFIYLDERLDIEGDLCQRSILVEEVAHSLLAFESHYDARAPIERGQGQHIIGGPYAMEDTQASFIRRYWLVQQGFMSPYNQKSCSPVSNLKPFSQ